MGINTSQVYEENFTVILFTNILYSLLVVNTLSITMIKLAYAQNSKLLKLTFYICNYILENISLDNITIFG